jgi:hypothetical protein
MPHQPWTLAIDPGLRQCGVSIFEGTSLHGAWLARSRVLKDRGPKAWFAMAEKVFESWLQRAPARGYLVHSLVVEVPQVYWRARRRGKAGGGNAADLIELAGVVGAISSLAPVLNRVHFLPRKWKGQVPKKVHNARVMKRLSSAEQGFIEPTPASLLNNVIDSVGLGLFHLGRLVV